MFWVNGQPPRAARTMVVGCNFFWGASPLLYPVNHHSDCDLRLWIKVIVTLFWSWFEVIGATAFQKCMDLLIWLRLNVLWCRTCRFVLHGNDASHLWFKSDMNSNAGDADETDLRGFCSRLRHEWGVAFLIKSVPSLNECLSDLVVPNGWRNLDLRWNGCGIAVFNVEIKLKSYLWLLRDSGSGCWVWESVKGWSLEVSRIWSCCDFGLKWDWSLFELKVKLFWVFEMNLLHWRLSRLPVIKVRSGVMINVRERVALSLPIKWPVVSWMIWLVLVYWAVLSFWLYNNFEITLKWVDFGWSVGR